MEPIGVTRTSLVDSERIGDNGSSDSIEPAETSTLARDSMHTEWTDEKHSLYLKSMEASFVDQLYNSSDLLGWRSQEACSSDPKSSRQMHASTRIPAGQFKVLRDGCWESVNFRRNQSQLNKADGSRVLSANPWIRHFRSGSRHQIVTSAALQGKAALATTSNRFPLSQSHLCCQDSLESNTEMSGQNFVDDDVEREQASRMCSSAKRMKTSVVATSRNDQVVPFGKFPVAAEDDAENCVSRKVQGLGMLQ